MPLLLTRMVFECFRNRVQKGKRNFYYFHIVVFQEYTKHRDLKFRTQLGQGFRCSLTEGFKIDPYMGPKFDFYEHFVYYFSLLALVLKTWSLKYTSPFNAQKNWFWIVPQIGLNREAQLAPVAVFQEHTRPSDLKFQLFFYSKL